MDAKGQMAVAFWQMQADVLCLSIPQNQRTIAGARIFDACLGNYEGENQALGLQICYCSQPVHKTGETSDSAMYRFASLDFTGHHRCE